MAKIKLSIISEADARIGPDKALLLVPRVGPASAPHITHEPASSMAGAVGLLEMR
jgi:hypothetical protein